MDLTFRSSWFGPLRLIRSCLILCSALFASPVQAVTVEQVSMPLEPTTLPPLISVENSWVAPIQVFNPFPPQSNVQIWNQPTNTQAAIGGSAFFSVSAYTDVSSKVPDPAITLHYRWFKNETNLVGGDASYFPIENVQLSHAGSYHVVVSNGYGIAESVRVSLTVVLPPVVTQPPQPIIAQSPDSATFTVETAGTPPFAFQWRLDGQAIQSATNRSLTLSNLVRSRSGSYSVVVTNVSGSVTSSPAALRVLIPQRLLLPQRMPNGQLRFMFGDSDGGGLSEADRGKFEVQSCTNLLSTNWDRLTNEVTLTNGLLMDYEPSGVAATQRFYRVIER